MAYHEAHQSRLPLHRSLVSINLICLACLPLFVTAGEASNSIAVTPITGATYWTKKQNDTTCRLFTFDGLPVDTTGVAHLNRIDEGTLQVLLACLVDASDSESVLIELKLTPEQLAKVVRGSIHLRLNGLIAAAAFKEYAGTFHPLYMGAPYAPTAPQSQISADGHVVTRVAYGAWSYAFGRVGCGVGDTLRVKWVIESPMASYDVLVGFMPYNIGVFTNTTVSPGNLLWSAKSGLLDRVVAGSPFPDSMKYYYYQGDVIEIELDLKWNTAKFFRNGAQVGGGAVTAVGLGLKLYPVVWFYGASSVRMEVVSMKMPTNVVQLLRRPKQLM